jgi:hypothetical protein
MVGFDMLVTFKALLPGSAVYFAASLFISPLRVIDDFLTPPRLSASVSYRFFSCASHA